MVEVSRISHLRVNETKEIDVCYQLISENDCYSVECFVKDSKDKEKDYCLLKNFTKVKEIGVHFMQLVANAAVLPVHLEDIWEDYIT